MQTKIIAALLLSILTSSCGTTKLSTKESSEFDSGKKGILQTYNQPLLASMILNEQPITQIISVDGEKLPSVIFNTDEKIAIDVGLHKIDLSCVSRSGYDERDYSEVIELDIKPYHQYLVRCSFDSEFGPNGTYTGSFSVKEKRLK
ncbi:MAG: hypothetical protein OEZ16_04190 [Chromatiales bacterium]|nr:hypothetical protein [Chromatiales bacterium]